MKETNRAEQRENKTNVEQKERVGNKDNERERERERDNKFIEKIEGNAARVKR